MLAKSNAFSGFSVPDLDEAVDELARRGVSFERYEGFDPAGNILAVLEQ